MIKILLGLLLSLFAVTAEAQMFAGQGQLAPYAFNVTAANTANFRNAYRAGLGVQIANMGDSTERGTDETALPYSSQFFRSWPMQLATLLNAAGINASSNNLFGSGTTTIADLVARDGRFSFSGTAVFGSVQTQGGASFSLPSATAAISFTTKFAVTKCDIYWRDTGAGNNFAWAIDGGSPTTIPSSGTFAMAKNSVSAGALGIHTITLSWVAGAVNIFGINCVDDSNGRTEITMMQWGVNGADSSTMVGNVGTPNGGRLQFIASFPPKLVICECGMVNTWRNSITVDTFNSQMLTLIAAVKAAGSDFMFFIPPYDNGVAGFTSNQQAYIDATYRLAYQQNVGVIDLRRKWISYANAVAKGWQVITDNIHPTVSLGHPDKARVIFNVIQAIK